MTVELMDLPSSTVVFLDARDIAKFHETTIGNFFDNAIKYIKSVHDKSKPPEFAIREGKIEYFGRGSDDGLKYLLYDEEHVVAGVIETRTVSNHQRYTFFRDLSCLEKSTLL